jgi:hypothetical protein
MSVADSSSPMSRNSPSAVARLGLAYRRSHFREQVGLRNATMSKRHNASVSQDNSIRWNMPEEGSAHCARELNQRKIELHIDIERHAAARCTMTEKASCGAFVLLPGTPIEHIGAICR